MASLWWLSQSVLCMRGISWCVSVVVQCTNVVFKMTALTTDSVTNTDNTLLQQIQPIVFTAICQVLAQPPLIFQCNTRLTKLLAPLWGIIVVSDVTSSLYLKHSGDCCGNVNNVKKSLLSKLSNTNFICSACRLSVVRNDVL